MGKCGRADLPSRTWNCSLRGVGCLGPAWVFGAGGLLSFPSAAFSWAGEWPFLLYVHTALGMGHRTLCFTVHDVD